MPEALVGSSAYHLAGGRWSGVLALARLALALHDWLRGPDCPGLVTWMIALLLATSLAEEVAMAAFETKETHAAIRGTWTLSVASAQCAILACGGSAWTHELVGLAGRLPGSAADICYYHVVNFESFSRIWFDRSVHLHLYGRYCCSQSEHLET